MKVFGVHQGESAQLMADFIEQTGVTFPIRQDVDQSIFELGFPPGVGYPYPRDVVIGKDLTIRLIANAYDADEMDALIERLLAE